MNVEEELLAEIRELKQQLAEVQARSNEEAYRTIFEVAPVGMSTVGLDGEFIEVNPAFEKMLGYTAAELRATTFVQLTHPTDVAESVRCFNEIRAGKTDHYRLEKRLLHKNGPVIWADLAVSAVYRADGSLAYTVALVMDITERKQVELRLKTFETLVENSPDAITMVSDDRYFSYVNPAHEKLFGWSLAEARTKQSFEYYPPQHRAEVWAAIQKMQQTGSFQGILSAWRKHDPEPFPLEISLYQVHDDAGMNEGTVGIMRDVTARLQTEASLRIQSEYLAALHETALALMNRRELTQLLATIITRAANLVGTLDGYIYLINEAASELEMQVAVGVGYYANRIGFPVKYGQGVAGKVWETGLPLAVNDYFSWSGHIPALEGDPYRSVVGVPLKSAAKIVGVIGLSYFDKGRTFTSSEIALLTRFAELASLAFDNARLFEELRHSQEKYQSVVNSVKEIIFQIDTKGRLTFLNPAWQDIMGYEVAESLGTFALDYVYPEDRKSQVKLFRELITGQKQQFRHEIRGVARDGSIKWLEALGQVIKSGGIATGIAGTFIDTTERKQAEKNRLELERKMLEVQKLESLGVLAGGIAHDFNNILVGVLANAGLAKQELEPQQPLVYKTIEQIELAARRAADLTRQMLAYSGRGRLVVQPLNLNALFQDLFELLHASLSKNIEVQYQLGQNLPLLEGDATQLGQVIMNLLINASEAIGAVDKVNGNNSKGGRIQVSTGCVWADRNYLNSTYTASTDLPEGNYVYFEVTDNGCGMTAETLSRIFEPFFTTKFTGRGLGLAAVLGIVRSHCGALKVNSTPGQGTVMRVMFPALATSAEISSIRAVAPPTRNLKPTYVKQPPVQLQTTKQPLFLIVDDEPTVCAVLERLLEKQGFKVLTAPNGKRGLELFKQLKDEITGVILDLTMPEMNGEQALRAMQQVAAQVKVIVMSGYSEEEMSQRFANCELVGFLQKPFMLDEVLTLVQKAMQQ